MSLASPRMIKVQAQIYDIKRAAVDQLIQDFLMGREAKKRGLSVEQLEKDIRKKAETVSEGEAQVVYNMNKARFQNKSFDEVKTMIMAQLKMQKQQLAVDDFVQELRGKAKVKINLQRPRYTVSPDDDPGQGNKNAPIVLIEFSDFQCPACAYFYPVLKEYYQKFKGQLRAPLFLEKGFTIKIKDYGIRGFLDRVDADKSGWEIIDYKTGNPKDKLTFDDKKQLLLYQVAVAEVFKQEIKNLTFYYLTNNEPVSFVGTQKEIDKVKDWAISIIEQILSHDFTAKPGFACEYCDFKSVCPYAKQVK